jgi:hypothetical protein
MAPMDWGSYYGGSAADFGYSVAPDGKGKVYFAGQLGSSIPMAFPGMQDTTYNGAFDAFLAKAEGLSCPIFTEAPANVTVASNSSCVSSCTLSGGSLTAPTGTPCPYGSTIQYRIKVNSGAYGAWTDTVPVYNQVDTLSIQTRCNCDEYPTYSSDTSTAVVTAPGTCSTANCYAGCIGGVGHSQRRYSMRWIKCRYHRFRRCFLGMEYHGRHCHDYCDARHHHHLYSHGNRG